MSSKSAKGSDAMSSIAAEGSCLCRAISFRVLRNEAFDTFKSVSHCHCSMCRKFHGAAFSTLGEILVSDLVFDEGAKESMSSYTADNASVRTFCKVCGSSICFTSTYNRTDGTVELALGLIDTLHCPYGRADCHIYVANKAEWYDIQKDAVLPECDQYRS